MNQWRSRTLTNLTVNLSDEQRATFAEHGFARIDGFADQSTCDGNLMHLSTDNVSAGLRAAMVYHYAPTGTIDRTEEIRGFTLNDWIDLDPLADQQ